MKKGYMFTLDAVFAIIVLIVGTTIVFLNMPVAGDDYYIDRMATDVINVLAHTQITDLCDIQADDCSCESYDALAALACSEHLRRTDQSILELYSETILTGAHPQEAVNSSIQEIFVDKNVIDETRFGFAILYTTPESEEPLELYATGGRI